MTERLPAETVAKWHDGVEHRCATPYLSAGWHSCHCGAVLAADVDGMCRLAMKFEGKPLLPDPKFLAQEETPEPMARYSGQDEDERLAAMRATGRPSGIRLG